MVAIPKPDPGCPTVAAAVVAWADKKNRDETRRTYLGMSSIGDPCSRKLWYGFHSPETPLPMKPEGRLAVEDGNRCEDAMAEILRCGPGIELHTGLEHEDGSPVLDANGRQVQIRVDDFDGAYGGGCDGEIKGLIQAPKTWHVWEHKAVNEKKWSKLRTLKALDEKTALSRWDPLYYAQAVSYMAYLGLTRHYLTASLPGLRALPREQAIKSVLGVRTDANPIYAAELRRKAERIITSRYPLAKLSDKPDHFGCRFCPWRVVCHGFDAFA
jgi:hypothetical protein